MQLVQTFDSWACPPALTASRVQAILQEGLTAGAIRVALTDDAGKPYLQVVQTAALDPGETPGEHRAPIRVDAQVVGVVQVVGRAAGAAALQESARLTASRLADAWRSALEIDNLAGEIVHAYEELHLLYELGESLTGQMNVARAADLILDKLLKTVPAARAELSLADTQVPIQIRTGDLTESAEGPAAAHEQQLGTVLRSRGEAIGQIVLVRPADAPPFSSGERKLLDAVGTLAGSTLRNAELYNAQLYEELRRLADTDGLTALMNHRAIQERLDRELSEAGTKGHYLSLLMVDIDHFKRFNDSYGHLAGDQVLRLISELLRSHCRAQDILGRYGGDEFLVLLPQTDRIGASVIAQRILDAIARGELPIPGQSQPLLALSIGLAVFPEDGQHKHDLLGQADAALYEAKRYGGNGVRQARDLSKSPSLLQSLRGPRASSA